MLELQTKSARMGAHRQWTTSARTRAPQRTDDTATRAMRMTGRSKRIANLLLRRARPIRLFYASGCQFSSRVAPEKKVLLRSVIPRFSPPRPAARIRGPIDEKRGL